MPWPSQGLGQLWLSRVASAPADRHADRPERRVLEVGFGDRQVRARHDAIAIEIRSAIGGPDLLLDRDHVAAADDQVPILIG